MKKILTILLVAILASATLFAVDISGRFRAGYEFKFKNGVEVTPWKSKEAKFTIKVSDDAGIWTINLKDWGEIDLSEDPDKVGVGSLDSNDKFGANLSLNMAALLAANGVEMGDVSLSVNIGANTRMTALSAYNDVTGDELFKLKNDGKYSTEIAVGYGDLIQTKIAVDPTSAVTKKMPLVISAMTTPVEGVSLSVGYAYNGYMYTAKATPWVNKKAENVTEGAVDHGVTVATNVNVGTLAGLDFDLGVTAYDNIGFTGKNTYNNFAAAVYGGVDVVDAYFEFRMDNTKIADVADNVFGMKTQVNFNVVENLGLDVFFNIGNFEKVGDTFEVGGDVSYTVSGVEFAANLKYAGGAGFSVTRGAGFSVTPKVIVVF